MLNLTGPFLTTSANNLISAKQTAPAFTPHIYLRHGQHTTLDKLKVGTYNLKDFFAPNDPLTKPGKAKTLEEQEAVAQVLSELNADMVLVQEVQNPDFFKRFVSDVLNPKMRKLGVAPYDVAVSKGTNNKRAGMRQAFLYREPLQLVEGCSFNQAINPNTEKPYTGKDILMAHFKTRNKQGKDKHFLVFNIHFKSNFGKPGQTRAETLSQSGQARLQEAYGIQALLHHELRVFHDKYPKAEAPYVIVGGDLNSGRFMDSTRTIKQILKGDALVENLPELSADKQTLQASNTDAYWGDEVLFNGSITPTPLKEAVATKGQPTNYAAYYGLPYPDEQFDYLFTSPHLPVVEKESGILTAMTTDDKTLQALETFRKASDHDPLYATFDISA